MDDNTIVEAAHEAAVEAAETQVAVVAAEQAATAAESAVVAAESAIALSAAAAAVVERQAADEVREVVTQVENTEENVSWLRQELENHRSADSSWKAETENRLSAMSISLVEISEAIQLLTQAPHRSPESPALTPEVSEAAEAEVLETAQVNPGAVVVVQEAPAAEASPRKRARKLL